MGKGQGFTIGVHENRRWAAWIVPIFTLAVILLSTAPATESSPTQSQNQEQNGGLQDVVWSKPSLTGRAVVFSPDGESLATPAGFGQIQLLRVSDGGLLRMLIGQTGLVASFVFSPDGQIVASGGDDTTIKLWRVSDGSLVRTLTGHTSRVNSVAFSPDGRIVASGSDDRTIKLWRVSDGNLVRTLVGHTNDVHPVAFSPDGQYLASGGEDGLALWRIGKK
jgi:WD40 repeat protein